MADRKTVFGRLLDALRSQRTYVPTTLTFPQLDIPAISDRLRLIQRGEENGRENRPPSGSLHLDRTESEIAALIQNEYAHAVDIYQQGRQTYERRIYDASLETLAVETSGAAQDAVAEYTSVALKAQDEIALDRRDLDDVEREFEAFQASHHLARGCRIPDGHITHIGVALLVLLLDTIANGYLLSQRDEFGLLGGMIQAIIVAGMNVALGFLTGRIAVPNIGHRSILRRLGGLTAFLTLLALILALNLSFAHYRDLAVLGFADPEQRALSEALNAPLIFHDVKSVWLGCIGVLFAFVSLIDGFKWDDPYPGYGELARRRKARREDYLDRKHYWLEVIKDKREQARAEVSEIRREITKIQGEISQASMGRRSFTASFLAHLTNLESAGNQLISMYRDANRRVRTTPTPPYFDEPWQLARTEVLVPSELDRDLLRNQVDRITASLSDALDKIHEKHDETIRAFDRLETRTSLPPESTPQGYLVHPNSRPFAESQAASER